MNFRDDGPVHILSSSPAGRPQQAGSPAAAAAAPARTETGPDGGRPDRRIRPAGPVPDVRTRPPGVRLLQRDREQPPVSRRAPEARPGADAHQAEAEVQTDRPRSGDAGLRQREAALLPDRGRRAVSHF